MAPRNLNLKAVHKIAVLRANALGDFIVTLPALGAIRSAYPQAEIVLLGKPWHKEFLPAGRTPVDRVIVIPVKKGITGEQGAKENQEEIELFLHKMQQEQFDIAIHFQGNGVSANPFIKQFNAKLTAGISCKEAETLDRSINFYYYQSEVIRYLEVARLVGAATSQLEPSINILQQDMEEIKDFVLLLNDKPFIVLHPFAVDVRRMWPVENYTELADRLHQKNLQIVFTGSEVDKIRVDALISTLKFKTFNACGHFTLGGLSALLSKAALVIAPDTGPLHLARAVNTPTVGLYWAPNLINWGPLTRGIHRPVISWKMECPYCGIVSNDPYPFEPHTTDCKHEVSFVRDVSVNAVMNAANELLPASPKGGIVKQTFSLTNKESKV